MTTSDQQGPLHAMGTPRPAGQDPDALVPAATVPPSDAALTTSVDALTAMVDGLVGSMGELKTTVAVGAATVADVRARSRRDRAIVIFDITLSVLLFAMGAGIGFLYNHNAQVTEQLQAQQRQIITQSEQIQSQQAQADVVKTQGLCKLYNTFFATESADARRKNPGGPAAYDAAFASLHQSATDLKCPTH